MLIVPKIWTFMGVRSSLKVCSWGKGGEGKGGCRNKAEQSLRLGISGARVSNLGLVFQVYGLGFRVWGFFREPYQFRFFGCRVHGFRFRVLGCRVLRSHASCGFLSLGSS